MDNVNDKLPDSEATDETHELNELPSDLQPLYRRLADDGASWQAASAEKLTALAQTLVARAEHMTPATREVASSVETVAPIPLTSRQGSTASQRPLRRREWIAGALVAVVVVVLLAIVLQSGLAGRGQSPLGQTQPTPKILRGDWQTLDKLTVKRQAGMTMAAVVAPSNIQVAYTLIYSDDSNVGGNSSLRRTTDGGNTWKTLPLTVLPTGSLSAMLGVSPLDARTLFLTFWDQSTACAEHRSSFYPNAGCAHNYVSTNSGDSWQQLALPIPAALNPGFASLELKAQGGLLYAYDYCSPDSCTHLLKSANGGLTWQIADGGVTAHGVNLCEFTLAPDGTTIYEVTSKSSCGQITDHDYSIWRSDDVGAHWKLVGPLLPKPVTDPSIGTFGVPGSSGWPLLAAPGNAHAKTLYLNQPYVTGAAHDVSYYYSEDSGATWQQTPALSGVLNTGGFGAGSGSGVLGVGTVTVLSDGSILFFAQPEITDTPYLWKPGTGAWQRLQPYPGQDPDGHSATDISQMIVTPGANGHDTLTLVVRPYDQSIVSTVVRYQF
ncbi:MAG TPA: sialidase family protein [Ktedonobacterales bacterium]|nr:sialidase family protein [Ktedonobacterales bacterium]